MSEVHDLNTRLMDALADRYLADPEQFADDVERALFYATGQPGWSVKRHPDYICPDCADKTAPSLRLVDPAPPSGNPT